MKKPLLALALLAFSLPFGCKVEEDAPPDPLAKAAGFCDAWAHNACQTKVVEACNTPDVADCESTQSDFCRGIVPEYYKSSKYASECLTAVKAAYKDGDLTAAELQVVVKLGAPCDRLSKGSSADGESCTKNDECNTIGGFGCIIKLGAADGTCGKPEEVGPGEACDGPTQVCGAGNFCNGENCVAYKKTGGACEGDYQCKAEDHCVIDDTVEPPTGACEVRAELSADCATDDDCQSHFCVVPSGETVGEMRVNHPTLTQRAPLRQSALTLLGVAFAALALGCDDPPAKSNPFDKPKDAPVPAPPASSIPKSEAAPILEIDTVSPKVGYERALLQHPEGKGQLTTLLTGAKRWIEGKDVVIIIDRKTKIDWVATYLDELGKVGPSKITIRTDTRKEFSQDQVFVPEAKAKAPPCSVVAMVMSDYGTAVWKLSGGTAGKRTKGMAGPDLSMTGDTIERFAKGCKESSFFFVSVAEGIEWGLAFDLAASSRVLEHAKFDASVLLNEIPTAGHKVTFKH